MKDPRSEQRTEIETAITSHRHTSQVYPASNAALTASYHHDRGSRPVLVDFGEVHDPAHLAVGLSLLQARVLWDQLAKVLQSAEIRRQELTEAFDRLEAGA